MASSNRDDWTLAGRRRLSSAQKHTIPRGAQNRGKQQASRPVEIPLCCVARLRGEGCKSLLVPMCVFQLKLAFSCDGSWYELSSAARR